MYYLCSEYKGADLLICAFVLAYAKSRFSHDAAHTIVDRSWRKRGLLRYMRERGLERRKDLTKWGQGSILFLAQLRYCLQFYSFSLLVF